ncbi:hypothetical protein WN51_02406 [Melipona quadrifasciata]|uniref:Uncharacterized protein n=1 Tax=Melipona quadrifasciata TaxID=166423 RepID=A0A0M8ZUR0_9HYME|nr:hypothetical protein WN51_02406 [Melipona quadrifasciata]
MGRHRRDVIVEKVEARGHGPYEATDVSWVLPTPASGMRKKAKCVRRYPGDTDFGCSLRFYFDDGKWIATRDRNEQRRVKAKIMKKNKKRISQNSFKSIDGQQFTQTGRLIASYDNSKSSGCH